MIEPAPLPAPDSDDWISTGEAVAILGINDKAFRRLVATGKLTRWRPPGGITGRVRYVRSEIFEMKVGMVVPASPVLQGTSR